MAIARDSTSDSILFCLLNDVLTMRQRGPHRSDLMVFVQRPAHPPLHQPTVDSLVL